VEVAGGARVDCCSHGSKIVRGSWVARELGSWGATEHTLETYSTVGLSAFRCAPVTISPASAEALPPTPQLPGSLAP
jgi:hypothetical protein